MLLQLLYTVLRPLLLTVHFHTGVSDCVIETEAERERRDNLQEWWASNTARPSAITAGSTTVLDIRDDRSINQHQLQSHMMHPVSDGLEQHQMVLGATAPAVALLPGLGTAQQCPHQLRCAAESAICRDSSSLGSVQPIASSPSQEDMPVEVRTQHRPYP